MKRKSAGLFQTAMREFQAALLEKESRDAKNLSYNDDPPVATLTSEQIDGEAQVEGLLKINTGMTEGLGRLQNQSRTIGSEMRQAYAQLDMEADSQERLSRLLLTSLREFEKELQALQDANLLLERKLHEKRLLLSTRKKRLDAADEQELALRDANQKLRSENTRFSRQAQQIEDTLKAQQSDIQRLKKQHLDVSRERDELATKYHQLFQAYNRMKRNMN